jgi:1-acyl-sn-glycerol-3-phosphate acyltransferase
MALFKVALFGFLYFLKLNIFELSKVKKIEDERKRVFYARNLFRGFGKGILERTNASVEVIYEDEEEFSKLSLEDPMVLISNHQSNIDIPTIQGYFPFVPGFMAKKEMETWMFFKTWMPITNSIFIDRINPREGIKAIRKSVKFIKDGYPMLVFPEGTRSETGEVGEFKNGGFKVAIDSKAKIIPITLKGTYDIQNKNSIKMFSNKKVKLIIGKVIDTKDYDREGLKNIHNIAKEIIVNNYNRF